MQLSGSSVLLTGASGGIGQAIARELYARGARLILTGRRSAVLEPLAEQVAGRALACDLSVAEDVECLVRKAAEVDILVANAGLPGSGRLESFTIAEIDRLLDVNLRAPIVLARSLLPRMLERRRGHLLFVSSLQGKAATQGSALYSATKFGLRGFAWGLRADLHASGVGVSCVFPGFIREAGMFADAHVKLPPGVGTRSPEDVAEAVVKAIEQDRAELDVAPLHLRFGATLAGVVPEIADAVTRRSGGERLADRMAEGQRPKR